jgi:hypothetical protein
VNRKESSMMAFVNASTKRGERRQKDKETKN